METDFCLRAASPFTGEEALTNPGITERWVPGQEVALPFLWSQLQPQPVGNSLRNHKPEELLQLQSTEAMRHNTVTVPLLTTF